MLLELVVLLQQSHSLQMDKIKYKFINFVTASGGGGGGGKHPEKVRVAPEAASSQTEQTIPHIPPRTRTH